MKIPFHLRLLKNIFRLFSNRIVTVLLSIILLVFGYIIDGLNGEYAYFISNASVVTAFGLILTIKHNYLSNIQNVNTLVESDYHEAECGPSASEMAVDHTYVNSLISKATDEGTGLVLILIGTLVNAYGSNVPLVSLCVAA
ncbi:TPA: hypothetical protein ACMDVJ_004344 [Vibrio parahaemolyticus]|uniref:hypothetical protein n=1 Tax=Vibrio alginolyticus TaxID=663 RepID=UPI00215C5F19|nr:hypothetical protein [Vibrio alginolyticus]MCR9561727.1 hypothetical protein [Vibrio alginolyticus]